MEMQLAQELIACLKDDRPAYYYYPERYGIFLLRHAAGRNPAIAALRLGPFAPLLQKPRVKALLAQAGGGRLAADWLKLNDWAEPAEHYRWSLSTWSGEKSRYRWAQTSRRGVNLVLQLNLSAEHIRSYRHLVQPQGSTGDGPFEYSGHPISSERETLAWARLDIDWPKGEALIEELQTDWLRDAKTACERARRRMAAADGKQPRSYWGVEGADNGVIRYYEDCLDFHRRYWAEAALTAALWLVADVIGLRRLWYHSWESGRLFKRCGEPPRSLYTDLPRRFCFSPMANVPALIAGERAQKDAVKKAVRENVHFYRLEL